MEVADCLSRNLLPIEVTEEEMAPILYTSNVTQQECGNSAMFEGKPIEDSGSLFQVTWGPVGQRATSDEAAALKATSEQVSHASDNVSSTSKYVGVISPENQQALLEASKILKLGEVVNE